MPASIMKGATATYGCYCDPGHAWVKVPLAELKALGIADKITAYSYQKGIYAYLEEDCDASTFYHAKTAAGYKVTFKTVSIANKSSRIRNYARYRAE